MVLSDNPRDHFDFHIRHFQKASIYNELVCAEFCPSPRICGPSIVCTFSGYVVEFNNTHPCLRFNNQVCYLFRCSESSLMARLVHDIMLMLLTMFSVATSVLATLDFLLEFQRAESWTWKKSRHCNTQQWRCDQISRVAVVLFINGFFSPWWIRTSHLREPRKLIPVKSF